MAKVPQIIGIVNITADSFYDGGWYMMQKNAENRAKTLLAEGADIVEISGAASGPNSKQVSETLELERVIPVIQAILKSYPSACLSVDTYNAAVAREALREGATIINDVSAGRADLDMFKVLSDRPSKMVLVYSKDSHPPTTICRQEYPDIMRDLSEFFISRQKEAIQAGVRPESIIIDPGLGYYVSANPEYSFEILAQLKMLTTMGIPVVVSPSRKSFLAGCEKLDASHRLPATIAASSIAVLHGASFIRTHDVLSVKRGCEIALEVSKYVA